MNIEHPLDSNLEYKKKSRLAPMLPEPFVQRYLGIIGGGQLLEYEKALSKVPRWNDKHVALYRQKESVLDHVSAMLEMVNNMEEQFPALSKAVDMEELRLMVVLHDSGEIPRGDSPLSGQIQSTKAKSPYELPWSLRIVGRINNPEMREHLLTLVHRAHERTPNDREALLTKFFDTAQAMDFGEKYVFPMRRTKGVGYQGTGSSQDPSLYATRCGVIMEALTPDAPAQQEFAELAEQYLFSNIAKTGISEERMRELRQSIQVMPK